MSEPWQEAWEANKDALAEVVHNAWMRTKLSHGFADHPYKQSPISIFEMECFTFDGDGRRCKQPKDKHHSDMVPFADLSDEIKAYDYETALTVFPTVFEAGRLYEREHRP